MSVGRGNYKRISAARRAFATLSRSTLGSVLLGALLLGCTEAPLPEVTVAPLSEEPVSEEPVAAALPAAIPEPNDKVAAAIRRVLAADKAEKESRQMEAQSQQVVEQSTVEVTAPELAEEGPIFAPVVEQTAEAPFEEPAEEQVAAQAVEPEPEGLPESEYFSWTATPEPAIEPEPSPESEKAAEVVAEVDAEPTATEVPEEVVAVEEITPTAPVEYVTTPFAVLMPPQMIAAASEVKSTAVKMPKEQEPNMDGLSDAERRVVEQVFRETSPTATGVLTDSRVNEMATASIREANALASRGAQFAAREKLVEAMRMISQAKDAAQGNQAQSAALAAGLRALEEAQDFAPRGTQLEGEMDVAVIVASHRTPIAKRLKSTEVPPRLMMDLYFRYAQVKLATAVGGEPAGSMSLYALGKVTSQIGHAQPDRDRLSHRQAVAYQQAALLAHNQNYFAAHELGVLMAESGRLTEAEDLLKQVAVRQPSPTVYRNLASVEQRMGKTELAASNRAMATQLASQGRAGGNRVQWVGPEAFGTSPITPTQYAGPAPSPQRPGFSGERTAMAPPPRAPQYVTPIPPGSWR